MRRIQLLMENVLYVWAIKNPETDYFQGLNDLLVPFILVHLAGYVGGDLERINVEFLTADMFDAVEADCFWCLDSFMRKLHLHFNITTPGINRMVDTLADYVRIVDEPLYRHFQKEKVEFTFFAIRWMICLLTREMHLDKKRVSCIQIVCYGLKLLSKENYRNQETKGSRKLRTNTEKS